MPREIKENSTFETKEAFEAGVGREVKTYASRAEVEEAFTAANKEIGAVLARHGFSSAALLYAAQVKGDGNRVSFLFSGRCEGPPSQLLEMIASMAAVVTEAKDEQPAKAGSAA